LRVALAGAGSVGTVVARTLKDKGHAVTAVWSRSPASAALASARLGCPIVPSLEAVGRAADVILIGAVDSAVGDVAGELVLGLSPATVVVHFAGSLGIDVLGPVLAAGGRGAALHPVQAISGFESGIERLPGSAWGITCSADLDEWVDRFVREDLLGLPVRVDEADRALWHAAAVMTSNGIAALMGSGMALLDAIGVADPGAVLSPLAAGTVANVRASAQVGDAFTGPVVRGDMTTIERHLHAFRERAPELLGPYRLAAELVIAGALRTGRIDESAAASTRALLETG
jgi:predicted short-subunit dehydrogenase-like oxidoreductase (DUF2520 family)